MYLYHPRRSSQVKRRRLSFFIVPTPIYSLPNFAPNNPPNPRPTNAVLCGEILVRHTTRDVSSTDLSDLCLRELSLGQTTPCSLTILRYHVRAVVGARTQEQVPIFVAGLVVTVMENT